MIPSMEFPEFLLNEPYILSPYKISVANYLLSYIEEKNYVASLSIVDNASELNVTSHSYLCFKLIMSLDCSYGELRSQLLKATGISSKVIRRFDEHLADLKFNGLSKFHDFFKKLTRIMQKKLFYVKGQNSSQQHDELYRIHKLSMTGFFLRKLIIHFERLSYFEMSILHKQFLRYLNVDLADESDCLKSNLKLDIPPKVVNQKQSLFPEENEPCSSGSNSKQIYANLNLLEYRLSTSKQSKLFDSDIKEHLKVMIQSLKRLKEKNKSFNSIKRVLTESSTEHMSNAIKDFRSTTVVSDYNKLKRIEHVSFRKSGTFNDLSATKLSDIMECSSMDLDETMEDADMVSETVPETTTKMIQSSVSDKQILEKSPIFMESRSKCRPYGQLPQQFFTKQVHKIMINEKAALSPPEIIEFINNHFEQNNSFHYVRFIQFNYLANLTLIKDTISNGNGVANNLNAASGSSSNGSGGQASSKKIKDLFQSISSYSDIHYLKYINALRLNNFTLAQESFYTYFDLTRFSRISDDGECGSISGTGANSNSGPTGGNSMNNLNNHNLAHTSGGSSSCWSVLNLAIMYAHFRYYRLAYEALTDCISVAREKRDESCLQFALIWMLWVLQQFDQGASSGAQKCHLNSSSITIGRYRKSYNEMNLVENLINLILFNEDSLPYIAAMAYLHLEKLHYLGPVFPSGEQMNANLFAATPPKRPQVPFRPIVLSVKHLMDDVLMRAYSLHAAILNAYGGSHLAALFSNLLLRLDNVDLIGEEIVSHVNENTAIALRNLAMYQWAIRGNYDAAIHMLFKFRKHFSNYNKPIQTIVEQAVAEITFEKHLFLGEWSSASKCINLVRCVNRNQALFMLAELRCRQNEPIGALECLDLIFNPNLSSSSKSGLSKVNSPISNLSGASFFRPNTLNPINQSVPFGFCEENFVFFEGNRAFCSNSASNNESKHSKLNLKSKGKVKSSQTYRLPKFLDSEEERPLTSDMDPYTWLSCHLLRATIIADLSKLLDCVFKAQAHGFKQLECRALLEIARLQQNLFGQYHDSQNIIDLVMVRLLSNGRLRDIALAYFLTATNHFYMYRGGIKSSFAKLSLRSSKTNLMTSLEMSAWANKRSIVIWEKIGERTALLESLNLAALIEHERNNRDSRNNFAKRARLVRTQLLKT